MRLWRNPDPADARAALRAAMRHLEAFAGARAPHVWRDSLCVDVTAQWVVCPCGVSEEPLGRIHMLPSGKTLTATCRHHVRVQVGTNNKSCTLWRDMRDGEPYWLESVLLHWLVWGAIEDCADSHYEAVQTLLGHESA